MVLPRKFDPGQEAATSGEAGPVDAKAASAAHTPEARAGVPASAAPARGAERAVHAADRGPPLDERRAVAELPEHERRDEPGEVAADDDGVEVVARAAVHGRRGF